MGRTSMLVGWIDLVRRPFTRRNDFVSVDARGYSTSPKNYEMINSPPTTYEVGPQKPGPAVTSPHSEYGEVLSPLRRSPPSPSSQYANDYFGSQEADSKGPQLRFSLPPQEAKYKSPKLSFSTPRPPSAGRSFSRESQGRHPQPPHVGRTSPARPISPPTGRESGGSTFSSAYDWDPTTTYASPSTHVASYSRPDAYTF